MVGEKSVPTGVKVISVLYYIGAVFGVLFGLLFLFGAGVISSALKDVPLLGAIGATFFAIAGVILLALSVLGFFVGRGLWNGRSWARIVAIVFACIGILGGIYSIIQGNFGSIVSLIIELVICGYLLFNESVKEAFV